MKKVVGTFERVSDASTAVRAVRNAGFLASDVELVVRHAQVAMAVGDLASSVNGTRSWALAGSLAGGVLGGLAGVAATFGGVAVPSVHAVLTVGPLAAALAGGGLGAIAGTAVAGITGRRARGMHAEHDLESLRRGGALVAVYADASRVDEVERILRQKGAYAIVGRNVRRRNSAWPVGNSLLAGFAGVGSHDHHADDGLRPHRASAGIRR